MSDLFLSFDSNLKGYNLILLLFVLLLFIPTQMELRAYRFLNNFIGLTSKIRGIKNFRVSLILILIRVNLMSLLPWIYSLTTMPFSSLSFSLIIYSFTFLLACSFSFKDLLYHLSPPTPLSLLLNPQP